MKPAVKKPDEPQADPGVELDDHVYFHHKAGPKCGQVVARGRHGVTVSHEGKHHKVKWEHVLGHKTRAQQQYDVLDQGEDGMIVKDSRGQRRYLAMPEESRFEGMMLEKSMRGGKRLLLIKGMPPAPGLVEKQITDKNGVQTKRWVQTNKGSPKAQKGQHVGFANGEHKGHGEVIAHGKDGVTVHDASGGVHRIPHDKISHHWEGEGAPDASPHDPAPDPKKAQHADDIARALFDTSEIDKLPAKTNQPVQSWDELQTKATEGLQQFSEKLGGIAQTLGLVTGKRPQSLDHARGEAKAKGGDPAKLSEQDYMLPEHWDDDRGYLFMGPLKGEERAKQKVETDYAGDWSQLRDMVRATIAVPMMAQIPRVLDELKRAGLDLAQKPKNNLIKPLPGGYRDLNLIVKLPNGMLAELQVHVKPMTLAKEKGHKPYETVRTLEAKYTKDGVKADKSTWDKKDRAAHDKAMAEQEKMYGAAWDRATKPRETMTKSNLINAPLSGMLLLWKLKGV